MSVINECRKGDIIYNITEGWSQRNRANPNNVIDQERKVEIGEELEFIDAYLDDNYKDKPYAWQVMFKCKDGYISNASQISFVTEDEWNELKQYFKEYYEKDNIGNVE